MFWTRIGMIVFFGLRLGGAAQGQETWEPTDFLSGARHSHSATLLQDGKVLVAGGWSTGSLATCELYDPSTGLWERTGDLETPRFAHTATHLPSGKVMVVGGRFYPSTLLANVELFDPVTGVWSVKQSLPIARERHTAILLPSGKVLVVGGRSDTGSNQFTASAVIYDPVADSWTATGSLRTARHKHTASLLPSGKVLVTGGENSSGILGSSEIYDPDTGVWEEAGDLADPRFRHTATLLPSGQVLVVGGAGAFSGTAVTTLASAELYDPSSGGWTITGSLTVGRYRHTATLLPSGRVLVIGGEPGGIPNSGTPVAAAEIYDPATGAWSHAGDQVTPRYRHSATLLPSGQVLVAGGRSRDGVVTSFPDAELFHAASGGWSGTGGLSSPRERHRAILLASGKVLAVGGWSSSRGYLADAELFDPSTGSWQSTGALHTAREEHTTTLLQSGKVLVVGGYNESWLSSAELYDPETGVWEGTASLLTPRGRHTATLLPSGQVLISGGYNGSYLSSVEIYDPDTGTWQIAASLNQERQRHRVTLLLSGQVLVSGGRVGAGALASAELYDPATGAWHLTGSLGVPRHSHSATLLPSGRVLVAGGEHGDSLSSAEIYDPDLGAWENTGALAGGRQDHAATLLATGKVLLIGGRSGDDPVESAELYDPATRRWSTAGNPQSPGVRLSAVLLPSGKVLVVGGFSQPSSVLFSPSSAPTERAPLLLSASDLRFGDTFSLSGYFRADSEASGGNFQSSSSAYPLMSLRSWDGRVHRWLVPDPRPSFWTEPATLTFSDLPSGLDPGRYLVTAIANGVRSEPLTVSLECSVAIEQQPIDQLVDLGDAATFTIRAEGARRIQWQKDGFDIPGANSLSYTTPPATAADAGTSYQAIVDSLCTSITSGSASLILADTEAPEVQVASPNGGEYWPLSDGIHPRSELVAWEMADNVRVCQVEAALLYSNNGGQDWFEVPAAGGLPAHFGLPDSCPYPGVLATSVTYTVPAAAPSGQVGSLYKVRVRAIDQFGNEGEALSAQPFFMVQPNPDSVKTLILHNLERMKSEQGVSASEADGLEIGLQNLAHHPRVQGRLVDLHLVEALGIAYDAWDSDIADQVKANAAMLALRQYLRSEILPVYTGVKSIVIVGDDRIVPMARIQDFTALPESVYTHPFTGGLSGESTVGQALRQKFYLSDDPLAVRGALSLPLRPEDFANGAFLPDLAVGRLVETPAEILRTIATFLSQDGILDLGDLAATGNRKVLVTGYDFLEDSAKRVRDGWQTALGVPLDPASEAPVNGRLIEEGWNVATVAERRSLLFQNLGGAGGQSYGINNLNGHGTHFEEGVPSAHSFLIEGLASSMLYGSSECSSSGLGADLAGSIVYAVGCHGGLPVPGSCSSDVDHSLDLPQTMMARGAVAYIANSGYGWGIDGGVGASERLIEVFSEELRVGGTVVVGEAFVRSKLRYFLEQPGFNVYDEKTLLQWTFFGLPMYAIRTGIGQNLGPNESRWLEPAKVERPSVEDLGGGVLVERTLEENSSLPDFLIKVQQIFDIGAQGVYTKFDTEGNEVTEEGCSRPDGCYYALNGIATGTPDLPVEPYFVYDSRIPGTSQHGVLWLGGDYEEEPWIPVIAELVSNAGNLPAQGPLPRLIHRRPFPQRIETDGGETNCVPSDLEINSMAVVTGEALKADEGYSAYSLHRLYRSMSFESLYFNDRGLTGGNCDRRGPLMSPANGTEFHTLQGARVDWAISASDEAGVWRVVVVYDLGADASGQGRWIPLELVENEDAPGVWRGSVVPSAGAARLTYLIQAVDRRGNVEWVAFEPPEQAASLLTPDLPRIFDVGFAGAQTDLGIELTDSPDPVGVGAFLAYIVKVTNHGPAVANDVTVVNSLPPAVEFLGSSPGWSCEVSSGLVTCRLPALGLGPAPPLLLFVLAPISGGLLVASSVVSAIEADFDLGNNTTAVTTVVSGAGPVLIFEDGFESGDVGGWSWVVVVT